MQIKSNWLAIDWPTNRPNIQPASQPSDQSSNKTWTYRTHLQINATHSYATSLCIARYAQWIASVKSWWRHQMEKFSAFLAICAGNSPVTGEFPAQRPVTLSLDVFFDLRLNKQLSKQSWGWWFETPSRQLWRHCIVVNISCPSTVTASAKWYKPKLSRAYRLAEDH